MKSHLEIIQEKIYTIRKITGLNEEEVKNWIISNHLHFEIKGYSIYKVLEYAIAYAKMQGKLPIRKDLETLLIVGLHGINPFLV